MSSKKFYKHITTGGFYRYIGKGRCVENPLNLFAVYRSTQPSILRETQTRLPKGTIWVRSDKDFQRKFVPVKHRYRGGGTRLRRGKAKT